MEYLDHPDAKPPHSETDIYVSDGTGDDDIHFTNRFHMHSFRYVRAKGASVVSAHALQISAVDPAGGATFECSDPRLNAIHDMVKYTLSCLTFSGYMVDCPHIERMGYGGDGNPPTNTLQNLWDVRDTYSQWMRAWQDALAGIRPDPERPGYRHFYIDPQPCEGIEWVRATKPTRYGDITVECANGTITVTVPEGTTATAFPHSARRRTLAPGKWTLEIGQ